jgi:hypothetical protein
MGESYAAAGAKARESPLVHPVVERPGVDPEEGGGLGDRQEPLDGLSRGLVEPGVASA